MLKAMHAAIRVENDAIKARQREAEVQQALDAAELAINEYYNGDREWAEAWLLKATAANKAK